MIYVDGIDSEALRLRRRAIALFTRRGVAFAALSGVCYGLYSAFAAAGMDEGLRGGGFLAGAAALLSSADASALSVFALACLPGVLGGAACDAFSAAWSLSVAAATGKLGDFFRCLRSRPGAVLILCALVGGPISGAAYLIALQMAGPIAIPITALCPAIGVVLGRAFLKQELNARMLAGVLVCVSAGVLIGATNVGSEAPDGRLPGCLLALVAAFGWGAEGCFAGRCTVLVDHEIGVAIRQCVSALCGFLVLAPLVSLLAGDAGLASGMLGALAGDGRALAFFAAAGLCSMYAFGLWYKGNSMCGAALGMACNGAYSFWGPLFCWLLLGLILKKPGWALPPVAWAGAALMFAGVCLIALNPAKLLKRKGARTDAAL
jgi:drug/metabolite transporter (DMT)-like permease